MVLDLLSEKPDPSQLLSPQSPSTSRCPSCHVKRDPGHSLSIGKTSFRGRKQQIRGKRVLLSTSPVGQRRPVPTSLQGLQLAPAAFANFRNRAPLLADELEHKAPLVPTHPPTQGSVYFSSCSVQGTGGPLCRASYGPHPEDLNSHPSPSPRHSLPRQEHRPSFLSSFPLGDQKGSSSRTRPLANGLDWISNSLRGADEISFPGGTQHSPHPLLTPTPHPHPPWRVLLCSIFSFLIASEKLESEYARKRGRNQPEEKMVSNVGRGGAPWGRERPGVRE